MRRTYEVLVCADTKKDALSLVRERIRAVVKARRLKAWKWLIAPESQKYEGRGKKLQGKWRAYGRIAYQ